MATDSTFVGTVELHHVFLDTSLADDSPQLHRSLTGQRDEVVSQVDLVVIAEFSFEDLFCLDLFDHGTVLVEGEGFQSLDSLTVEELLDRHNPLVVLGEVVESDSSLEADEGLSQVKHYWTGFQSICLLQYLVQAIPRATAGISFVWFDISVVL